MEISEKEFAVIREISNNHLPDQRTIAQQTGISLGLTNLIIKKLVQKGYIKARQLNKKKIQYLLTSKGFAEKANKSYAYTLKTIGMLQVLRQSLENLVIQNYNDGAREFTVDGGGDLANVIEWACANVAKLKNDITYRRSNHHLSDNTAVMLIVRPVNNASKTIDILSYLSETGILYY